MIARALTTLLLMFLAAGHPVAAAAAEPAPLLADYTHTAWTELDDAPMGVTKFAQGPDGWLWIATPTGLYRYDGVHFERTDTVYGHALYSSNIMALATAPDGAVWVGYRVGGISVFRKDGTHTYMERDGIRPVGVMHLEVAPDGAIWAAMRDGLAVLPPGGNRFQYLTGEAGLPARGVFQILFARDGTTWIGTNSGAYFRKPGEARFTHAWPRTALVWLAEAPDGTLWGNDFEHGYHRVRTAPPPAGQPARPELAGVGMYFDRRGTMWITHADSLERRVAPHGPGRPEQFLSTLNGISGALLGAIFQDREGNLWIGTSRGVDRLRPNRLRTVPVSTPLEYPVLVAGPDGGMWAGDYARDLWRYSPDRRIRREVPGAITASYTAPDGTLWLGGMEGIVRRAPDGTLATIASPDGLKGMRVHAMQQDRDGALWASFNTGTGVYKLAGDRWVKSGGLPGIPELLTTSMARDGAGALWMAHVRSQVTVIDGGTVRRLGPGEGLALGTVLYLCFDGKAGGGTMWAGGENGVALYRNGRFTALQGRRNERFRGVSGIVRLPDGDLWLHGADGLYRIAAAELDGWLNHGRAVDFERFDARDGMQGHAAQLRPVPSLRRSRDGLLWYATTGSVGTIDPAGIARNRLPPPVEVTGVLANGTHHAITRHVLGLPQGTSSLQVDFAALSLSIPERVRLRYRLVGLDRAWQETDGRTGRRQATYTNLAPGNYRFEVIAANEDGLWNMEGAALEIAISPTFVQSAWFKVLLAMLALVLLYAAYALRIRYLTRRMHDRLHERLAERTRIARTLHDTLLQSMQSLLLSFDAHSRYLKEGTLERTRLDQTLDLAERLLVEGRDQIMELREGAPEVLELTLGQYGKGLADHGPHAFDMRVAGTPRPLRPAVHEEIYAIAREALFNASRYADASRIELDLEYGSRAFTVRIRDDGRGLAESVAAAGHRPGHWGLVGMRERASCVGATLEIASKPGAGTEITVTLPARKAY
ncbi:sensor histidine kinase [Pseudoduganella albidiflava]|uniref:Histidine kinase n=1 Tax=Pseudoduganella albidiflava TaxID=321983 RepID=A0A411X6F8_9BURK|nr:sensor histidine kinase [Pseudoduganella albidiflava]QBI04484.1 histidine kinase [Pseudoduganella albidiflava]GGY27658.1 histidine kinase [Pseudoduganella albidiflava]